MRRLLLPNYISAKGAVFESPENFAAQSVVVDSTADELSTVGFPLIKLGENRYATSSDELHCFVIGDSGCGKTRRVILPSIRLMAKARQSMIISDPRGELFRTTSAVLKSKGYDVQVLNLKDPLYGNRWNPLGIVDKLYHKGDDESKDRALSMLDDILVILSSALKGLSTDYRSLSAVDVMRGICHIILGYSSEGSLTFENVAVLARSLYNAQSSPSELSEPINEFLDSLPDSSPILSNLNAILHYAKETRERIMSSFEAMISIYNSRETFADLFYRSEIDISNIGRKPSAVYIILPDYTEALYPIATVFVQQVYSSLISDADAEKSGKLPVKVNFLLDEFSSFAKIPAAAAMLTAARRRNIRFCLVCQAMNQLIEKYGENGFETIISSCHVWIYLKCCNMPFMKRLQDLSGEYISPYTGSAMPLISIDALQRLGSEEVFVFNDRCRPIRGILPDYSKYDFNGGNEVYTDFSELREKVERDHIDPAVFFHKLSSEANMKSSFPDIDSDKPPKDLIHTEVVKNGFVEDNGDENGSESDGFISCIDYELFKLNFKLALEEEQYSDAAEICEKRISEAPEDVLARGALLLVLRRFSPDISNLGISRLSDDFEALSKHIYEDVADNSLMWLNLALYWVGEHEYAEAVDAFKCISDEQWPALLDFLKRYSEFNGEDEENLAIFIAELQNVPVISPVLRLIIMRRMQQKYKNFIDSDEFRTAFHYNDDGDDDGCGDNDSDGDYSNDPDGGDDYGGDNDSDGGDNDSGGGEDGLGNLNDISSYNKFRNFAEAYGQISREIFKCFDAGNDHKAISICIENISAYGCVPLRNNLAFMLRFSHINPSDFESPVSLEIRDLLKIGIYENEPFSLMNAALYEIQQQNYDAAVAHLIKIGESDWDSIFSFWLEHPRVKYSSEAALVGIIGYELGTPSFDSETCITMNSMARTEYADFLDSFAFKNMCSDSVDEEDYSFMEDLETLKKLLPEDDSEAEDSNDNESGPDISPDTSESEDSDDDNDSDIYISPEDLELMKSLYNDCKSDDSQ